MLTDLKNKRVLVTGSSTGIGAAVAKGFAAARRAGRRCTTTCQRGRGRGGGRRYRAPAGGKADGCCTGDVSDSGVARRAGRRGGGAPAAGSTSWSTMPAPWSSAGLIADSDDDDLLDKRASTSTSARSIAATPAAVPHLPPAGQGQRSSTSARLPRATAPAMARGPLRLVQGLRLQRVTRGMSTRRMDQAGHARQRGGARFHPHPFPRALFDSPERRRR